MTVCFKAFQTYQQSYVVQQHQHGICNVKFHQGIYFLPYRAAPGERLGRLTPKTYENNFIHHYFLQFWKEHSRYKVILSPIVSSQQCFEVCFIPLTVANLEWELTCKYYRNRPPPNFTGWICPCSTKFVTLSRVELLASHFYTIGVCRFVHIHYSGYRFIRPFPYKRKCDYTFVVSHFCCLFFTLKSERNFDF